MMRDGIDLLVIEVKLILDGLCCIGRAARGLGSGREARHGRVAATLRRTSCAEGSESFVHCLHVLLPKMRQ